MGLVIYTSIFIDAENGRIDLSNLSSLAHYGSAYVAAVSVSVLLQGVDLARIAHNRVKP